MKKLILTFALLSTMFTFAQRDNIEYILGYLCVFPNELGYYNEEPKGIIRSVNEQALYGYNTWRLPTKEELQLLKAHKYLQQTYENGRYEDKPYMTQEYNKYGNVLLVTSKKENAQASAKAALDAIKNQQKFIDLGLPSGTKWFSQNALQGEKTTFDHPVVRFIDDIPTKAQWLELIQNCKWEKVDGGIVGTGRNGNKIFLPYDGWGTSPTNCSVAPKGQWGAYWSSTDAGAQNGAAFAFTFSVNNYDYGEYSIGQISKSDYLSIRLVRK